MASPESFGNRNIQAGDLITVEYDDETTRSTIAKIDTSDPKVLNISIDPYLIDSGELRHYVTMQSGRYVVADMDYEDKYFGVTFQKAPEIYENNATDNYLRMVFENTVRDITLGFRRGFRPNWSPWIRGGEEDLDGIINSGIGYWKKLLFDPDTQERAQRVLQMANSAPSPTLSPPLSPHLVQRPTIQYDPIDIIRLNRYHDDIMGGIGGMNDENANAVRFARRYDEIQKEYNRLLRAITKPAGRLG